MADTGTIAGTAEATNGSGTATLASLSEAETAKWRMTGELPEPNPSKAVSDPDDDDEPPVSEPAKPAATAATATPEKPVSKRQQQINALIRERALADEKAAALEKKLADIEARIAQPAKEPTKAEPAKAKTEPSAFPTFEQWLTQAGNEDKDWYAYQTAWYRAMREAERAEEAAESERKAAEKREADTKAARTQTENAWAKRREDAFIKDPALADKLTPFLGKLLVGTPTGDTLMESPVGMSMAAYLSDHPDDFKKIQDLEASGDWKRALRALGIIEAKFDVETTSTSASAGPAAKTVTTAPVPPVTLSARAADTADPLESALKDRDFRRYEAEANARDLAGSKR